MGTRTLMKVKLKANWCSDWDIKNRIIRQFGQRPGIELVIDNSYDVIVFFNYITEDILPGRLSFIFPQEPYWSGNHQKNIPPYITKAFVHDIKHFTKYKNVEESIAYTSYGGRGEWIDSPAHWNLETIRTYNNNKTKNISSAISTLGMKNEGSGPDCLYQKRIDIVKSIISNDKIDFFCGWQEYYNQTNIKTSPYKIDTVKDYKFTIIVENEFSKNWVTEKFYDAILYETVPIYLGCSNIKEIYPEDGYILIHDDIVEQLEILTNKESADEIYNILLPGVKSIKRRYLKENNILAKLEKIGKEYGLL